MATPFVAGVIALMLQREPRLTPEEIQQRLRITARRDRDTRRVWGSGFGFGKIDVEALLDYEAGGSDRNGDPSEHLPRLFDGHDPGELGDLGQALAEGAVVERLAVDEHAVEIKDDGLHCHKIAGSEALL